MSEQRQLDPTVDIPPSSDGLPDAVGPDSEPQVTVDGSVLQALSADLPSVPRILLREPESFGGSPIVQPSSEEMPSKQDPAARLQLQGEIARGGMGAVLKGRDVDLGRDVAVKVLLETHHDKSEMIQRFVEEAQISGQLQHPGIAPVYELGRLPDSRPYFTMKLVKGKTLATLLTARKDPAEESARFLGIFVQVCQTLAYAHARGVIHRDLKPSNIMVGAFGEVQVMDWGLAKVLKEGGIADEELGRERERAEISVIRTQRSEGSAAPEVGSQTQAGTVLGTPAYMAPEQARGEVELVDERADVFGLGAILCEILTGKPPYVGKGAEIAYKARTAKLEDAFVRLESCGADEELIALARRCLAAELWERPRDAGVVAMEVTDYQNSVAERLRQAELARAAEEARAIEARATAAQERRARRMTLALAATVLLTVLLGGGGWLWLHTQRATRLAENNRVVKEALTQAALLHEQAQKAQGRAALDLEARAREQTRHAEMLAESGPIDEALTVQLRGLLAELEADKKDRHLLAALDAIRLAHPALYSQRSQQTNFGRLPFGNWFFDRRNWRAVPQFREAFRDYGLPVGEGEATAVAARLQKCPAVVREAVVAALDKWIALAENPRLSRVEEPHLAWLQAFRAEAEPEGWGKQVCDAAAEKNAEKRRDMLNKLAETADVKRLSARAITRLADRLWDEEAWDAAIDLLRRALAEEQPSDFWINEILGGYLIMVSSSEATPHLRAAVALRPDSAEAHLNLGIALKMKGMFDLVGFHGLDHEVIAEYRKAIDLEPKHALAHYTLGLAKRDQGKLGEAIAEFRKVIELDPTFANVHYELGFSLQNRGQLDGAIAEFRKASEVEPNAGAKTYYRYTAACHAALVAVGWDADTKKLDANERSRLRKQALDWLRADLAVYGELLQSKNTEDRALVQQRLQAWEQDNVKYGNLSGLSDKQELANLPSDERQACEKLWADVAALLKKVREKK